MAWLNTAPEVEGGGKRNSDPPTRLTSMQAEGQNIILPPNPAKYLTDWLFEIGPTLPTGMGEAPIGFTDISAWASIMNVEVAPWEAQQIRRLSRDFIAMRHDARKRDCPMPFDPAASDIAARKERVDDQFKMMLRAFRAPVKA